jgi:hypothetical protein
MEHNAYIPRTIKTASQIVYILAIISCSKDDAKITPSTIEIDVKELHLKVDETNKLPI